MTVRPAASMGTANRRPVSAPRRRWDTSAPARWAAVAAVLIAWGLRLWDIGALRVFGDSSYSVYLAGQPVLDLLWLTGADSHPPLYYLLLAGWLHLLGWHEMIVRFVSLAPALITIPLTFQLGRRVFGDRPAVIAAVLLAVSPFAFHYARLPRMYGWVMLAILVAILAFLSAVRTERWRDWIVYAIAAWAGLHLQYFAALGIVALNLWALPLWRQPAVRLRIVRVHIGIGLLSLPWFLVAFLPSAAFTAGNISNAPPPAGLLGFLEQYVIPFAVGVFVDESIARPVAWLLLALLALLAAWLWLTPGSADSLPQREREGEKAPHLRPPNSQPPSSRLLAVMVFVPLALTLLVFLPFPFFARQRFLLFALPFALLLVGRLLDLTWQRSAVVGATGLALMAGAAGLGLGWVLPLERYLVEPDAVQLADVIRRDAGPSDVLYLQAAWQHGYLRLHGADMSSETLQGQLPLRASNVLAAGRPVWAAIYGIGDRDPRQPLPAWLDEHATKVFSATFGPTRVARYVPRPAPASPVGVALGSGSPVARLERVAIAPDGVVRPGGTIAVGLDWTALRPAEARIAFFLHLDDLQGRTWAGRDGEPLEGIRPADHWQPGERIADSRGLTIGTDVPAGEYRLVLGAYQVADSQPVPFGSADGTLELGRVRVGSAPAELPAAHRVGLQLGDAIRLEGYETSLDRPIPTPLGIVNGRLDTPIELTRFRDAYHPGETVDLDLHWRASATPDRDYTVFVHVVDAAGKLVAQQDGPPAQGMRPTTTWRSGELVMDHKTIALPPNLAPGSYRLLVGLYRHDNGERLKSPPDARGRVQDAAALEPLRVAAE